MFYRLLCPLGYTIANNTLDCQLQMEKDHTISTIKSKPNISDNLSI